MIARDGADGAADVDDFRGSEIGRERGDHAAARHGNLNVAEIQKRMAAEIDAVGLHYGDCARGVDGGIPLNENHTSHVAGNETPVIGPRRSRAALRRDEAVALQLICELLERGRLEAGKNERRFDGLERGARRQTRARGSFTGKPELLHGCLRGSRLGRRVQHILDGSDPGDGLFGEDAQFQRQGASKFAVELDRAPAHSRNHAGVFDFWTLLLYQDDGLPEAKTISLHADVLVYDLFHLIAGKDRIGIALHARAHLAEGKEFVRFLGDGDARSQPQSRRERQESEEQNATRLGQKRPRSMHESVMIRGVVPGSNQTGGAERLVEKCWAY